MFQGFRVSFPAFAGMTEKDSGIGLARSKMDSLISWGLGQIESLIPAPCKGAIWVTSGGEA